MEQSSKKEELEESLPVKPENCPGYIHYLHNKSCLQPQESIRNAWKLIMEYNDTTINGIEVDATLRGLLDYIDKVDRQKVGNLQVGLNTKTGKWTKKHDDLSQSYYSEDRIYYSCSECGRGNQWTSPFCPHCGIKMEEFKQK